MNKKKNEGSALVESTVLIVVLLPVIFGLAMIGKIIDVKQTTVQAGRYAAWESTVYPDSKLDGAAQSVITERFFGSEDNVLQSHSIEPGQNRLWGEEQDDEPVRGLSHDAKVMVNQASVRTHFNRNVSDQNAALSIGKYAAKSGKLLESVSGNTWGLSEDGLIEAAVSIELRSNSWLLAGDASCSPDGDVACLESRSVILTDGWSASSDDHARQRVRSLMPASVLGPLGEAISHVGNLPLFGELKRLDGSFGHVDMSVLPEYAKP